MSFLLQLKCEFGSFRFLLSAGLVVMFSPGAPQLWHEPSPNEVNLWDARECPVPVCTLLAHGHSFETVETLLTSGATEYNSDNRTERDSAR
ncbi:MAG TPA: hypothetical protein VF075_06570 [Pyrinomonadaceae bacterium]